MKNTKDVGVCTAAKGIPVSHKSLDGNATYGSWQGNSKKHYCFILPNNSTVEIAGLDSSSTNYDAVTLIVDINGLKAPNVMGKDYFFFSLNRRKGAPMVSGIPHWWTLDPDTCSISHDSSGGWYGGGGCTTWLLQNWNMDYLHREIDPSEWYRRSYDY